MTKERSLTLSDFTQKKLVDYKVYVFDLDNTLYLHKVNDTTYHKNLKHNLIQLKDKDKILCIASHNVNPEKFMKRLGILDLFDKILYEHQALNPRINDISQYTKKSKMIKELLSETKYTKEDVVFFDDYNYNIKDVSEFGIRCVLVDELKGVDFTELL